MFLAALLSVPNLARATDYHHRRHRPANPTGLDFVLGQWAMLSDFFVKDVSVDSDHHVIFGTSNMLNPLRKAKKWYVDGTCKVVKRPFRRLFTIHTFVQCNGAVKQIPLIHVLMLACRKHDYHAVLCALLRKLPATLGMKTVILNFELALWRTDSWHQRQATCMCFHWAQAVFRKLAQLRLSAAYR